MTLFREKWEMISPSLRREHSVCVNMWLKYVSQKSRGFTHHWINALQEVLYKSGIALPIVNVWFWQTAEQGL